MTGTTTGASQQAQSQSMRPFLFVWAGQACSLLGSQLVQFALVWWLTKTTGSATVLAFASIIALLPQLLISPVAGVLVDRWNRRNVMLVADSIVALATVALAALFALNMAQVWHIYILMFIRAVGGAFHWPAMQASTTLMVPKRHLSRVAGLNQTLHGFANIISPPLGALLIAILPTQRVLAIDVGTLVLAVVPLLFISIPQPVRRVASGEEGKPSVLTELRDGLRFVWDWSGMRILIAIASLHSLVMSAAFSLTPILVTGHFEAGAPELGWMQSAAGIGTVLGGVVIGVWGGFRRRIVTAMLAAVLQGIGTTVLGLAPTTAFPLAVGVQFFALFVGSIGNSSLIAILQTTVPPGMQARVFTLVISLATAMSPIGLAIAGPVADVWGVQSWFLFAGVFTIGIGVGAFFIPALMRIEEKPAEDAATSDSQ